MRLILASLAIVLLVIFVVQNAGTVEVHFFFTSTETPLIWALLLTAGLGVLIGLALPYFWRRPGAEEGSGTAAP